MSITVNPELSQELKKYGINDANTCFNCGNCTAVCPLSKDDTPFPRKAVRYIQLGMEDKLTTSLEPWLCYYCGECSDTCPREADPGETMMGLRRFLTAKYDWTKFGKKLYTSKLWEILSILVVSLAVILLFVFFHGEMDEKRVDFEKFMPVFTLEVADWIILFLLSFFLLSNVVRMHNISMKGANLRKIPLTLYIKKFGHLIGHFLTQRRMMTCDEDKKQRPSPHWLQHILLMSGYSLMFFSIVVLLRFWRNYDTAEI
jgi:ferredoxin